MIAAMRGTWIVAAVFALGLVLVGFFAQGMSRLAGLPAGSTTSLPAVATATAATESTPSPPPSLATTLLPPQAPPPVVEAPAESRLLQAIATAPDAAPEVWPPSPIPSHSATSAPAPRLAHTAASPQPVTTTSLSPEERRVAQCHSLRAWQVELDAIARARGDADTLAWVQTQRATTRERETELRC